MNLSELEILTRAETLAAIEANREEDPETIALRLQGGNLPGHLIATQVKLRNKSAEKMPSWVKADCIFTPLSYEQASSEITAQMKFREKGKAALDLTMGQGVDTWQLARQYESVIAVEMDEVRARLAAFNFSRLGMSNIRIVTTPAEDYLHRLPPGQVFDLIYIDPARRDATGRRTVSFSDCEPDIRPLIPTLLRHGKKVMIKASPMIDIATATDELGVPAQIEVLSVNGECREVLFTLGQDILPGRTASFSRQGIHASFEVTPSMGRARIASPGQKYRYLLEPDVAIYKSEIAPEYFENLGTSGVLNHPMGYFFCNELPDEFMGRAFEILESWPYKPKSIKKSIAEKTETGIHISSRNFDIPVAILRKRLGFNPGEGGYLLFTRMPDGERWVFWTQRIF